MNASQLAGWTPIRFYWQQSRPFVDWCYLGEARFTDPFFDQTIEKRFRHPCNLLFRHQTPVEALAELQAWRPALPPDGFIFHMSRCGSTLVSQALAALPQNIVISEAGPVDSIIRANRRAPGVTDEQRSDWLRWMIGALGQRRCEGEQHFFIKFDAWHALSLPLLRRAFPGVPMIFLYREPIEVAVSQLQRATSWMLSGVLEPFLLQLDPAAVFQMPREEYCARVLARICEAVLQHPASDIKVINYRQLPEAIWSSLLRFFHVAYAETDIERMREASRFDAKSPTMYFAEDTVAKNRAASEEVRRVVDRWVRPPYERLEALRAAQEEERD